MITVPEPVRAQLQAHMRMALVAKEEIARLSAERNRAAPEYAQLKETLNFRERHLGGALGGDKQKVRRHRRLGALLAGIPVSLSEQEELLARATAGITTLLDSELQRDPAYASLRALCVNGETAERSSQRLTRLLQVAINEVDEAQIANLLDGAAADAFAALDYGSIQGVHDALQAVNGYLSSYRRAIEGFRNVPQSTASSIRNLDEFLAPLDITDLVTEFGVGDLLQVEELENCEKALRALLLKVECAAKRIAVVLIPLTQRRKAMQDEVLATL